jgi:hypothetical protein
MVDPRVVLVALAVATVVWLGGETIRGVRWVKHHVQAVAHHVRHPHEKDIR